MANLDSRKEHLRKSISEQKEEWLVPSDSHTPFPDGTGVHAGEGQKDTQDVSGSGVCFLGLCCAWLIVFSRLWYFLFFSKKSRFLSHTFL